MCSIFIKAVESIFVEEVDCCRLLCAIESSSFVEAVESVVEAVDCLGCYELLRALVLLKLLIVEAVAVESVFEAVDC